MQQSSQFAVAALVLHPLSLSLSRSHSARTLFYSVVAAPQPLPTPRTLCFFSVFSLHFFAFLFLGKNFPCSRRRRRRAAAAAAGDKDAAFVVNLIKFMKNLHIYWFKCPKILCVPGICMRAVCLQWNKNEYSYKKREKYSTKKQQKK